MIARLLSLTSVIVLSVYLLAATFGIALHGAMPSLNCECCGAGHTSQLCHMPPAEHLAVWQGIFHGQPKQEQVLPVLCPVFNGKSLLSAGGDTRCQRLIATDTVQPWQLPDLFRRLLSRGILQAITYG